MPVVVVGTEKNFAALRPRLFSGRVSPAVARDVAAAVRAANPDIDLDKLRPGTVLTVPDVRGVRTRGELSLGETVTQGFAQLAAGAADVLGELVTSAKRLERERAVERKALEEAMAGEELQAAAHRDQTLGADLVAARAAVADEEVQAKERTAALGQAQKEWLAELEALKSLAE
ncbi:MAG: hypothetical protein ABIR67_15175 [Gaiellaceae bacterium]